MEENKKDSDTNSDDDHQALDNEPESLLMLKLVELGRLKEENILIHSFEYEEDIAHLEYENHPGDAEGDERALDEAEDPQLNKLDECCHQWVGWAKGLREYEGSALKIYFLYQIQIRMMNANPNMIFISKRQERGGPWGISLTLLIQSLYTETSQKSKSLVTF